MLKNASILTKFTLVFVVSFILIGAAYYLILRNVYNVQLQSQARTIADNVESFGSWVSQYGRVWVKDNDVSFLGEVSVKASSGDAMRFFSKNPALAQREFSEVVARSDSHAKFRMTSDNYMNPKNKPDAFEAQAIGTIKNTKQKEYAEVIDGTYRYARALYHKPTCIKCHGAPGAAPADVINRYGSERGFGFKAGDVAGIISVSLPSPSIWQQSLHVFGPLEAILILLAFVFAYWYMRVGVVVPMQNLTKVADTLSTGKDVQVDVQNIPQSTRNEMYRLVLSVNRLRTSLQIAIRRMKEFASNNTRG